MTIVLVVGMMVSSNCSRFLVFQKCVSIVVVSVSTSFLVFGGSDMAVGSDMALVSILFVLDFCSIFGSVSIFFYFVCNQCRGVLCFLFFHRVYILGILNVFDWSIYICVRWF